MSPPPLRVATICTGNICRSPMAEVVLRDLIANDPELAGHVLVTSAGTARWHVNSEMDPRARAALDRAGFLGAGTPGTLADTDYLDRQDLVVVMTREHRRDVKDRLSNPATEVLLWRNLIDPGHELDVADPYYGDDQAFDDCLFVLSTGGLALTKVLRSRLGSRSLDT